MKWITCAGCNEEFRVVSDSLESVAYCPFCGDEIFDEEDDLYDEEKED